MLKDWKESKFWRTIRRGLAVAVADGIAVFVAYMSKLPAEEKTVAIIMVTTLTLMGEKYFREYIKEKKEAKAEVKA